jgi:uncharacterized protein (DUF1810 family)
MWYIFPQIRGLGHSSTAIEFAISSREEAEAYLKHPILGPRLRECTQLVNVVEGRSSQEIFGHPDDIKFRSSMTLFLHATPDHEVFETALRKYFGGQPDRLTLHLLWFVNRPSWSVRKTFAETAGSDTQELTLRTKFKQNLHLGVKKHVYFLED